MSGLQQQLSELQSLFKEQGGSKEKVQQRLSKLKVGSGFTRHFGVCVERWH